MLNLHLKPKRDTMQIKVALAFESVYEILDCEL